MWIPLDILLTIFIFIYQVIYKYVLEEDADQEAPQREIKPKKKVKIVQDNEDETELSSSL